MAMVTSRVDGEMFVHDANLLLQSSETTHPDGRRSVVREAVDPSSGNVARRETEEHIPAPHNASRLVGGKNVPHLVREEVVMTELPGGATKTTTTRYYADGSSSVSVKEDFMPSMSGENKPLPQGTARETITTAQTTAKRGPRSSAIDRNDGRPVSPYEGVFANEDPSMISRQNTPAVSSADGQFLPVRDEAFMTVQGSDDDDNWSTSPQSTTNEAASRIAGEDRWRNKISLADTISGVQHMNPTPMSGTTNAAMASQCLPEMEIEEADLPLSSHPDPPGDEDPMLAKQLMTSNPNSDTYTSSQAPLEATKTPHAFTDALCAGVDLSNDDSTYAAAEIGDRVPRNIPPVTNSAASNERQPLELPMYRSRARPGTAEAILEIAATSSTPHRTGDVMGEELSIKTDMSGGQSPAHDADVPIAAEVAKDDFKSHLLSHRKTQVGCAALALIIVVLAVGLGVTLGTKPSASSNSTPQPDDHETFWEMSFPNIDGKHEGGGFGASVSMNHDGTRVAIGSPGVWDNDEEKGLLRRGIVEVRELSDGEWVRIGNEIKLSACDDQSHILTPNVKVRNLIQVVLASDGNTVAVGSSFHDTANMTNVGQVEVFRWTSTDWARVGEPVVGTGAGDFMGASVSLSDDGGFLAVGAPGNDDNGEDTGCVAVFFLNRGLWTPLGTDEITCAMSGDVPGEMFGGSVSLSADGKRFAVGLSGTHGGHSIRVAKVFKFDGEWKELGTGIDHGERIYDTAFSAVLSKDGGRVVVSNHYIGENGPQIQSMDKNVDLFVGAFEYKNDIEDWLPMGVNLHLNSEGDKSGYFITLSDDGNMIGMGDPGRSVNGGKVAGHAHIYVYDNDSGDYRQVGPNIDGEAPGDRFGYEVSLSGTGEFYAVGAPSSRGNGFEHGRVQVYKVPAAN